MRILSKLREWFGAQDMTRGRPIDGILRFSIPLLIGNIAQQLYNTVDSIIVGEYIGDTALSAVGVAGPIINLMIVLFMGISTGASILSAQFFGARNRYELDHTVGSSIFLVVLSGLFVTIVGYFGTPFLISLMAAPDDIAAGAIIYLQIVFLGMLGGAAYNILSGILRGLGDSVFPLLFLVLASLLNIVLDIVFVKDFGMGIAGVAWATIIAQGISGVLCFVRLACMKDTVDVSLKTIKPHAGLIKRLCALGVPAGITSMIYSLASILVQRLTNSIGPDMIAASVAVMRVDGFAMMPNFTFGVAATTYVGQNVGAKDLKRVHDGVPVLLKVAVGTGIVLVAAILLFGKNLIQLFSDTPAVVDIGVTGLRWLAFGYICFAVTQVLQGVMRGAGDTMVPMWISIFTTVILRMPLAYLLAYLTRSEAWPAGNPGAVFASQLIAWVTATALSIVAYRFGSWKKKLPQ